MLFGAMVRLASTPREIVVLSTTTIAIDHESSAINDEDVDHDDDDLVLILVLFYLLFVASHYYFIAAIPMPKFTTTPRSLSFRLSYRSSDCHVFFVTRQGRGLASMPKPLFYYMYHGLVGTPSR